MTCPHGALEEFERFPETLVAQVRGVEDDAEAIHPAKQFATFRSEPAAGVGALRVPAGSVMCRANRAKALLVRELQVTDGANRIGAFQAEDVTDWRAVRGRRGRVVVLPELELTF